MATTLAADCDDRDLSARANAHVFNARAVRRVGDVAST